MEKNKVLITYATYGQGHKTVAENIYNYLKEYSNYEIKIIDVLDYGNKIAHVTKKIHETNFKNKTGSLFFSMVYEFFDYKTTTIPYKIVIKSLFKNKKLKKDIIEYNPDILISTHFFGSIMVSMLNQKNLINTKIMNIITDYTSHEMWLKGEKQIDAFVVTNDIVKNELINKNINSKKIYSFGIPISEKFQNIEDTNKIKAKYHINNKKQTYLFFAGGGLGSASSIKFLKKLLEQKYEINIIFVCGKNEQIKKKIENLVKENNYINITILGFSKEVNALLSISDIVITKPGGISITECLEMKKPMLLIPGLGGNEIYNAKFICKNGYGIMCKTPKKLIKTINSIQKRKSIIINMKKKLDKYKHNNSLERIYKLSKSMLKK